MATNQDKWSNVVFRVEMARDARTKIRLSLCVTMGIPALIIGTWIGPFSLTLGLLGCRVAHEVFLFMGTF
jgi:hypothetical protein